MARGAGLHHGLRTGGLQVKTVATAHEQGDRLVAEAETYCQAHGLRLTPGRRSVLNMVARHAGAVKAYDLLEALTRPGARVMPPVVYRALDFWVAHGFVHRIASLNAYVACGHPLHNHGCQVLICDRCGEAVEVCNPRLRECIEDTARASGFRFEKVALEIHGCCPPCQARA